MSWLGFGTPTGPWFDRVSWRSRTTGCRAAAILAVLALAGAHGCQRVLQPAEPPGSFVVAMTDYRFTPARATWHVGEKVMITLIDESEATPAQATRIHGGAGAADGR